MGTRFPSTEHAYQAAKCVDANDRQHFIDCTPGQSKRRGKLVLKRPDWNQVKLNIMYELCQQKFQHPDLMALLMATDGQELIEGNTWGDTYWGVCGGEGSNHLGQVLMQIRSAHVMSARWDQFYIKGPARTTASSVPDPDASS